VLEVLAITIRQENNIKGKHRLESKKNASTHRGHNCLHRKLRNLQKNGINEFSTGMQDMR
jgi:hypothetical protein